MGVSHGAYAHVHAYNININPEEATHQEIPKNVKHFTTSIAIIKQSDCLVLIMSSSSFGWMRRCCSCGMHCCAITEIVSMV